MSAPARKYKILSTLEVSIGFKWPIIFVLVKGKIWIFDIASKKLDNINHWVGRHISVDLFVPSIMSCGPGFKSQS